MKLVSLSLRGAVGIERGMGIDQVDIDFTQFEPGIIAFVAPNGTGKTSILESLHPYRCLVSRPGALQNHFYLRDSHRVLTFEMNGHEYTCKLLIDAQTGKQESYLYCDGAPLTDGKTTTYDAEIAKIFGSEDLFFRSLFRGQGAESIAELKAAQRKALFVELLGLGKLQEYHESAKERLRMHGAELERLRAQASVHRTKADELPEYEAAVSSGQHDLRTLQSECDRYEAEVRAARDQVASLERDVERGADLLVRRSSALEAVRTARGAHEDALKGLIRNTEWHNDEAARIEASIERHRKITENAELIRTKNVELGELNQRLAEFDGLRDIYDARRADVEKGEDAHRIAMNKLQAAERRAHEAVMIAERELDRDMETRTRTLERITEELASLQKRADLVHTVPCAEHAELQSACRLLEDAREAAGHIDALLVKQAAAESADTQSELRKVVIAADMDHTAAKEQIEELTKEHEEWRAYVAGELSALGYDVAMHQQIRTDIAEIKAKGWDKLLSELATAEGLILQANEQVRVERTKAADDYSVGTERVKTAEAALTAASEALAVLDAEIMDADSAPQKLAWARADLSKLEDRLASGRDTLERIRTDLATREARIAECRKDEARAIELETEASAIATEVEEWALLARACGKDGIQALELDAAGPNVSAIANQLLTDTFGSQFQIAFETTRMSADGKKQLESFDIKVYTDGTEQTIETLSGGQRVWIEAALSQAIAIYLRRKSGLDLRTSYLDEADGALDSERAFSYLSMLRHSHTLAGTHHTFLITHRQELLAHVPQQIRLVPGVGAVCDA